MIIYRISLTPGALTLMSTMTLTALAVYAGAASHRSNHMTASEVIRRLDREVQPRFQKDAGMFGTDRIMLVDGHRQVDLEMLADETATEKHALKPVSEAPYFMIMGMMHVRHKPGSHIGAHDAKALAKYFTPSAQTIEASGTTYQEAMRRFAWGERNLGPATMWAYDRVRRGQPINSTYGKYTVAVRPVKARRASCITCHVGAHVGDTLGAMVYMVAPTPNHKPAQEIAVSDEQHQDL